MEEGRQTAERCESHGVRFDVAVAEPTASGIASLADDVAALLPPGTRRHLDADPAPHRFDLRHDGGRYVLTTTDDGARAYDRRDHALHALDGGIRAVVSLHAPDRIFVHAGVVGLGAGALVLPGRSFAGKTTLVAALLGQGATYFSDEYAVFDPDGTVHPFPRRLSVRDGDERSEVPAAAYGAVSADGGAHVVAVAALQYREGATWRPEEASAADAALALVDNTVAARSRPVDTLSTAATVARGATFLRGERGDADEAARWLIDRFA